MATERVGILIETMGYEKAIAQMKQIERAVSGFSGKNAKISLDDGRIVTVNQRIKELRRNIEALKSEKVQIMSDGGSKERIKQINKELRESRAELGRLQTASAKAGASLKQTFDGISSKIAHLGSAMQSLGNAIGRIWSPFRTLLRGTVFAAGYKLLNMMTTGIAGAAERADVFKTYANTLMALGYDANEKFVIGTGEAKNALDNLEDSVLGLPTSLDEIVSAQKKYLAASGDIVKATKAAIAANNIFLAQGSDQKDQLRGARQIRNLLAGGKMTSARWQSILESMPLAVNEVGRQLGYADNELDQFRKDLVDGKIDAQDFLNALLEVGTSGRIRDAVEMQKHTFGAVAANITTAFRRMGENVLKTMDEILMRTTGKDTIDWLLSFKGAIDKFSVGLQNWMKAHPDIFTRFIEELKRIDWNALLTGIGDGLVWSLERLYDALHMFEKMDMHKVGKFFGQSGMISFFLTTVGGIIKGSRHIFAAIGTGFAILAHGLISLGGVKALGGVKTLASLSQVGSSISMVGMLKNVAASLAPMLKFAGAVVIGGVTGMVAFKAVKSMVKDFGEIAQMIGEIDWANGKKALLAMGQFFAAFAALSMVSMAAPEFSATLGAGALIVGAITTFIAGVAALDMKLLKSAVKSLVTITSDMQTIIDNVNSLQSKPVNEKAIGDAIATLDQIYSYLKPKYQGDGIQNLSARTAKKMAQTVKALSGILTELNSVADQLNNMNTVDDVTGAQLNIEQILGALSDLYESVKGYYSTTDQATSESMKETINNITGMVTAINGVTSTLSALSEVEIDLKSAKENISGISKLLVGDGTTPGLFQEIRDMFTEVWAKDSQYSINSTTKSVPTQLVKDSAALVSVFENLAEVISAIRSAYDAIVGEEGFSWDSSALTEKLASLKEITAQLDDFWSGDNGIGAMAKNFADAADFSANVSNVASTIKGLREALNELNELAGMDVNSDLSGIIDGLSALKPQLESIKATLSEFGTAFTEGMIESFKFDGVTSALSSGLDSVLTTANGYKSKMTTKGIEVGKAFVTGIKSQLSSINVSTTVNVSVNTGSISGVGAVRAAIAGTINKGVSAVASIGGHVKKSRGGYIYRAGGGGVPSRGTDTVPAMLTPGEYVTRRRAVRAFGKDFMNRVNNLDVAGAMKALNARFGSQINNSRTSTVNNVINNNNNQRVTQNINTNSQNFAFKRASRFAGAF